MSKNNYILGGGISGLIWNFYNPDFKIITPEIGGQFGRTNLIWLHDTMETRQLLVDLGWKNPEKMTKKSYIGYYYKEWIAEYQTQEMNLEIIQKKMTNWNEPINENYIPASKDLSLSTIGGSNYMNTLDVDLIEIIKRLESKCNIVNDTIIKIDDYQLYSNSLKKYKYDKLISTIPATTFWKLCSQDKSFQYKPISNFIVENKPSCFDDKFEMIYYDRSMNFSRISHLQNKYAIEFTGIMDKTQFEKIYPELKIISHFVIPYGRIFNEENKEPVDNIIFSGRFAQWKYGITVEWVIKQVMDYQLKQKQNATQ